MEHNVILSRLIKSAEVEDLATGALAGGVLAGAHQRYKDKGRVKELVQDAKKLSRQNHGPWFKSDTTIPMGAARSIKKSMPRNTLKAGGKGALLGAAIGGLVGLRRGNGKEG